MDKKRYAGVAVKHDNKLLFCKRNNKGAYPGMWSIPGGSMEPGEDSKDSAKREFFEEMGVNIDEHELNFVGLIPRYTRDGKKLKGLMYVYLNEPEQAIIPDLESAIDGEEHTECKYATLDDITPEETGDFMYKLAELLLK